MAGKKGIRGHQVGHRPPKQSCKNRDVVVQTRMRNGRYVVKIKNAPYRFVKICTTGLITKIIDYGFCGAICIRGDDVGRSSLQSTPKDD